VSSIDSIESWKETVRLSRPYRIANHDFDSVELLFVRLGSDDGRLGLGSASPAHFVTGETVKDCEAALSSERLEDFLGRDPTHQPALGRLAARLLRHTPAARAAVDMALLDLWGRCLDRPLVDLLGRVHDGLPTSITIGIKTGIKTGIEAGIEAGSTTGDQGVQETLDEAEEYLARGFRCLKVKLGDSLEEDLERLARLTERLDQKATGVTVRVDANQGYERSELALLLRAAGALRLELIEQPVPVENEKDLESVPPDLRRLLAADESLLGTDDALRLSSSTAPYGVFNVKLMKCGGVSAALAISRIAEGAGRKLMWGCMDESVISIAAALHGAYACRPTRYLDLDGSFDLARDPASGGFVLRDGCLYLTDEPGLGVDLT